jgi:hypothetical protein
VAVTVKPFSAPSWEIASIPTGIEPCRKAAVFEKTSASKGSAAVSAAEPAGAAAAPAGAPWTADAGG